MKAEIHARVSTHDQHTLNRQIEVIQKYAKARDWQQTENAEIGSGTKG